MAELSGYKRRKRNICTGMFQNAFGNRGGYEFIFLIKKNAL